MDAEQKESIPRHSYSGVCVSLQDSNLAPGEANSNKSAMRNCLRCIIEPPQSRCRSTGIGVDYQAHHQTEKYYMSNLHLDEDQQSKSANQFVGGGVRVCSLGDQSLM